MEIICRRSRLWLVGWSGGIENPSLIFFIRFQLIFFLEIIDKFLKHVAKIYGIP